MTDRKTRIPGSKLQNGALVVAARGDHVVAYFGIEYVAWRVDANGHAFCGRYFPGSAEGLGDAVACLLKRS